jgi:hypothetical protein
MIHNKAFTKIIFCSIFLFKVSAWLCNHAVCKIGLNIVVYSILTGPDESAFGRYKIGKEAKRWGNDGVEGGQGGQGEGLRPQHHHHQHQNQPPHLHQKHNISNASQWVVF